MGGRRTGSLQASVEWGHCIGREGPQGTGKCGDMHAGGPRKRSHSVGRLGAHRSKDAARRAAPEVRTAPKEH